MASLVTVLLVRLVSTAASILTNVPSILAATELLVSTDSELIPATVLHCSMAVRASTRSFKYPIFAAPIRAAMEASVAREEIVSLASVRLVSLE